MKQLLWFLIGGLIFITTLAGAKLLIQSDLTPKTKLLFLCLIMIAEPIGLICCAHMGDKGTYKETTNVPNQN